MIIPWNDKLRSMWYRKPLKLQKRAKRLQNNSSWTSMQKRQWSRVKNTRWIPVYSRQVESCPVQPWMESTAQEMWSVDLLWERPTSSRRWTLCWWTWPEFRVERPKFKEFRSIRGWRRRRCRGNSIEVSERNQCYFNEWTIFIILRGKMSVCFTWIQCCFQRCWATFSI